jgi:hypothetical protein
MALCPACHEGEARRVRLQAGAARGRHPTTGHREGWSKEDAALYLEGVFETWAARSRYQWTLITVLETRYGVSATDAGEGLRTALKEERSGSLLSVVNPGIRVRRSAVDGGTRFMGDTPMTPSS